MLKRKIIIVYLDYNLIYSETWEQHIKNVINVLSKLREHILYDESSKSEFRVQELEYLGFFLRAGRITMNPSKKRKLTSGNPQ